MKATLIFAVISFFALSSYSAAADCAKYKSKVQQAICEKIEEAKGIASGKISKTTKKEKVKKEKIKKESKQPKTLKALGDLLKKKKEERKKKKE